MRLSCPVLLVSLYSGLGIGDSCWIMFIEMSLMRKSACKLDLFGSDYSIEPSCSRLYPMGMWNDRKEYCF